MLDGRLIQLNPMAVASKRRTPLLADFFHRLKLMERRGSGMKKIIGEYKRFEKLENYHVLRSSFPMLLNSMLPYGTSIMTWMS